MTRSTLLGDSASIEVRGLRRVYGTGEEAFEAVRGIDLVVGAGTIVALLGTNGAGKTSALELVEGLARPTAGQVRVLGLDPVTDRAEVRRRTGVLLQTSGFPADLTVAETLRMWASTMTSARPVADALAELDLAGRADVRVRSLSGGELRRLDLACTLLGDPDVVLLDEPTTGLDPQSRRRVWDLVADLRDRGRSVLLDDPPPRGGRGAGRPGSDHACRSDCPGGDACPARCRPGLDHPVRRRSCTGRSRRLAGRRPGCDPKRYDHGAHPRPPEHPARSARTGRSVRRAPVQPRGAQRVARVRLPRDRLRRQRSR